MKTKSLRKMVLSALFLALGLLLPLLTGNIPQIGKMLLPMHLPVFLCALICGWPYGLAVGFITPLMRSVLFGAPVLYPMALAMAFELAAYGLVSGFLYGRTKKQTVGAVYAALVPAMLAGRLVWAFVEAILLGVSGSAFTFEMFMAGAFFNALPGIALQLVLIPAVMAALDRTQLVPFQGKSAAPKA